MFDYSYVKVVKYVYFNQLFSNLVWMLKRTVTLSAFGCEMRDNNYALLSIEPVLYYVFCI